MYIIQQLHVVILKLSGNYLPVALFLPSEGRRGYFVSNKKYTNKDSLVIEHPLNQYIFFCVILIKKPKNRLLPSFSPDFTLNKQIFFMLKSGFFSKSLVLCLTHSLLEILPKNTF